MLLCFAKLDMKLQDYMDAGLVGDIDNRKLLEGSCIF